MNLLLIGIALGLLASVLGWQINLIALHRGIDNSRRACFLTGMGACAGDLIYIGIGYFGGGFLLAHPEGWSLFKWFGVVLLIITGIRVLRQKELKEKSFSERRKFAARHFVMGFVIVLANPVILILWTGINGYLLPFVRSSLNASGVLTYTGGFIFGSVIWFSFLAFVILQHVKEWHPETFDWFRKITGFSLVLAAIALIFEKM